LLFNRSCTRLLAHQPSTATAWTFFQIAWTDSESRPRPPDVRIEIQDHSRRHSSSSAILLSKPGSKRWMSMVMADDENSDFVANDAEREVIREPRKFALRISRSRIEKESGLSA